MFYSLCWLSMMLRLCYVDGVCLLCVVMWFFRLMRLLLLWISVILVVLMLCNVCGL